MKLLVLIRERRVSSPLRSNYLCSLCLPLCLSFILATLPRARRVNSLNHWHEHNFQSAPTPAIPLSPFLAVSLFLSFSLCFWCAQHFLRPVRFHSLTRDDDDEGDKAPSEEKFRQVKFFNRFVLAIGDGRRLFAWINWV